MIDTPDERNSKCGTCGSWEECKCPSPYDDEEWLAQQRADAMMEEDMIDTDKYERLHNLAHCKVLTQLYADDILDLLAEVKRLRKTLACIAFSPDDPKWVGEKLDELEVDSDTWKRWIE
jgi:hypothetical protein